MAPWRIIPLTTYSAAMNMAVDEAILQAIANKESPPTIRFYTWLPSAVSIGRFQSMKEEVAIDICKKNYVDVVRRKTGGGAVYHDEYGEITYSVLAPERMVPKDITKSYHLICGWIINGLKKIDLEGSFHPINDVLVNGKKISGNAQTRRKGVVLQHGTILYDVDVKKMFSLLKVGQTKIADKLIQTVEERITCIKANSDVSREDAYKALYKGFTEKKRWNEGFLSTKEVQEARELALNIYSSKEWNFNR